MTHSETESPAMEGRFVGMLTPLVYTAAGSENDAIVGGVGSTLIVMVAVVDPPKLPVVIV
jgi:hypothetical protein